MESTQSQSSLEKLPMKSTWSLGSYIAGCVTATIFMAGGYGGYQYFSSKKQVLILHENVGNERISMNQIECGEPLSPQVKEELLRRNVCLETETQILRMHRLSVCERDLSASEAREARIQNHCESESGKKE